ncbi:hypothetical protein HZS_1441 [Henneguya salminicola]|nr:hypothetical protein HZS_1441 [Henneguya salminicola]
MEFMQKIFSSCHKGQSPQISDSLNEAIFLFIKKFLFEQLKQFKSRLDDIKKNALCKTDTNLNPLPDLDHFQTLFDNLSKDNYIQYFNEFNNIIQTYFQALSAQTTYLDIKAFEFHKNNYTLNEEVESLKYALSHRLEMQQLRVGNKGENCQCNIEIDELKDTIKKLQKELKNKETEIEVVEENKRCLLDLMACTNNTNESVDENYCPESIEDFLLQNSYE